MSFALEHRRLVLVAALLAIVVVGVVDDLTGPLISVAFFYVAPTVAATAVAGWRAGAALAALSGFLTAGVLDVMQGENRGIATWNGLVLVVTLASVVALVDHASRRAKQALEAEARGREFLAMAAHQLRTPIAGMRSSAEALLTADPNSEARELLLAGLTQQSDRVARLLTSLLRMARLDQHEPLPSGAVDLTDLTQRAVGSVSPMAPRLTWNVQTAREDPVVAACSGEAVLEAVTNLLDNARRHARSAVCISIRRSATVAEVSVSDDGPGPPPGSGQRIFDRFVTLDGRGGSGLGLSISRAIAEAHGGALEFEHGAFVLRLPSASSHVEQVHERWSSRWRPQASLLSDAEGS
ncbi:MAG: sensor histidine kinase [Acidimicrobiales bacterium]